MSKFKQFIFSFSMILLFFPQIGTANENDWNTDISLLTSGGFPKNVAISKDNQKSYVAFLEENVVGVFDLNSKMLTNTIKVGKNPAAIALSNKKGYVTNLGDGTISVIDLDKEVEIKTLYLGEKPVSVDLFKDRGYVIHLNGLIDIFDLESDILIKSVDSGIIPKGFGLALLKNASLINLATLFGKASFNDWFAQIEKSTEYFENLYLEEK